MRTSTVLALVLVAAGCSAADGAGTTTGAAVTTTVAATSSTSLAPATSTTTVAASSTSTTSSSNDSEDPVRLDPFDTWITVLASLPTAEQSRADAEAVAGGLSAGVLLSDDYGSLNPGYWVVFRGGYDFEWEAQAACPAEVSDCYARYLAAVESAPIGEASGTAVAVTVDGELVVIDTSTGALARTLDRGFGGDGSYPGAFTLADDGNSVYYTVGFEDFWFSCDASDGTLLQYDFAAGRSEQIGDGFSPDVSIDGRNLLYLASSECFPDPTEPQWVLAPIDTIVRRDLVTGIEDRVTIDLTGDVAEGYELWSAVWGPGGDVFVLDTDGVLWRLAVDTNGEGWVADLERIGELEGGVEARLVGWDASRDLLLYSLRDWSDDRVTTTLRGFDRDGPPRLLASVEGEAAFALDHPRVRLLTVSADDGDAPGAHVRFAVPVAAVDW